MLCGTEEPLKTGATHNEAAGVGEGGMTLLYTEEGGVTVRWCGLEYLAGNALR